MRSVTLGATPLERGRCNFCVWAPRAQRVEVRLVGPPERLLPLKPRGGGYFQGELDAVAPGRSLDLPWRPGAWDKLLDSAEVRWGGPGSQASPVLQAGEQVSLSLAPHSLVLFVRREDAT